jgi:hypothetical protein
MKVRRVSRSEWKRTGARCASSAKSASRLHSATLSTAPPHRSGCPRRRAHAPSAPSRRLGLDIVRTQVARPHQRRAHLALAALRQATSVDADSPIRVRHGAEHTEAYFSRKPREDGWARKVLFWLAWHVFRPSRWLLSVWSTCPRAGRGAAAAAPARTHAAARAPSPFKPPTMTSRARSMRTVGRLSREMPAIPAASVASRVGVGPSTLPLWTSTTRTSQTRRPSPGSSTAKRALKLVPRRRRRSAPAASAARAGFALHLCPP